MRNAVAVLIALLLLGLGFALGRYAAPPAAPATPDPLAALAATAVPPARPVEPLNYPSPRRGDVLGVILDVLDEPDAFARIPRLAVLLPGLGSDAVPEIRAALEDPAMDLTAPEIELMLRFWATYDPQGAANWALVRAPRGFRVGAVLATAEEWAKSDPAGAANQVKIAGLVPTEATAAAEIGLTRGWFESGRPGLIEYVEGLGISPSRQRALGVIARRILKRDGPEAVREWAEALPTDDARFKLEAYRQVARELTTQDPADGAAWCDAHCDGPYGSNLRKVVAGAWAAQDGPAAMRWVSAAPPGDERIWAVKEAFRSWLRADRVGLSAWLDEMGADGTEPWFDPAVELVAIWRAGRDPTEGLAWGAAIRNETDRERTLTTVARIYYNDDPTAAQAWLESSPLSEEARARVLAPAEPGRVRGGAAAPEADEAGNGDAGDAAAAEEAAPES